MSRAVDETGYVQPTRADADRLARREQRRLPHQPDHRLARFAPMAPSSIARSRGHEPALPSGRGHLRPRRHRHGWRIARAMPLAAQQPRPAAPAKAQPQGAAKNRRPSASAGRPRPRRSPRWDIDVGPDGAGLPPGRGTPADGAPIYAARCAGCHGKTGKEGPNDVLVGRLPGDAFPFARDPRAPKTIGSYWPYATTVFDYIRRAMPPDTPGSLKRRRGLRPRRVPARAERADSGRCGRSTRRRCRR